MRRSHDNVGRHLFWCDATRCQGLTEHVSDQFVLDGQVPLVLQVFQRAGDPVPLMSLFELDDEGYVTVPFPEVGPLALVLRHIAMFTGTPAALDPPGTSRPDPDRQPGIARGRLLREREIAWPVGELLMDTGGCQVQTHPVHGIVMRGAIERVEEDGELLWVPVRS